ncbi:MlaE family ABC transporter permease [Wolinella succinogenes]|uniref:MlaE family ABC transporter permease n=1 Tax=Wolinella succinogenes TaxID=844 RepID=UPI00240A9AD8|nr:ABC transporter permease [Wolinella succinogenes]
MVTAFFGAFGRPVLLLWKSLEKFGEFLMFHLCLIPAYFTPPFRARELFIQMESIGVGSFWVIVLTSVFTGMVLAIQFYQGFHQFGAENFMSYPIFLAITRELGPVFAALMLTSRAISAMAAELGTMRVTEQIDAIDTLAVDSKRYLIVPRILASTLSLPLLVILFNFIGNLSAYFISIHVLGVNEESYRSIVRQYLELSDLVTSLVKAFVFGYLVSLVGTYIGYNTRGGARGVGRSTTSAVVFSAVTIFGANYLLSAFFLAMDW